MRPLSRVVWSMGPRGARRGSALGSFPVFVCPLERGRNIAVRGGMGMSRALPENMSKSKPRLLEPKTLGAILLFGGGNDSEYD